MPTWRPAGPGTPLPARLRVRFDRDQGFQSIVIIISRAS
jgi:hypothetical protein